MKKFRLTGVHMYVRRNTVRVLLNVKKSFIPQ